MIKILFLINTLGGGGAERVLVNLVNNMDRSVYDITVETMFDDGVNRDLLNKDIKYISKKAPCPKGYAYIFRVIPENTLYRYFIGKRKYDIIVAYMHGAPVKVISGCKDSTVKKFSWLHNGTPETGTFFKFWLNKKRAFKAYKKCDGIVGVSQSVADAFSNYTGIKENISVVYNTSDVNKIKALACSDNPSKADEGNIKIVSVGRISEEKGYDRLLNVCCKLKNENYNIDVTIVGSGRKENELKESVKKKSASEWFKFTGYDSNPYKYVSMSDIFVCSSYDEGLSTAVTEAVILGKPVVSTDVSGAKEILGENNEYGIVTENSEEALYEGLKKMIFDEKLREYYAEKSKERAAFFDTSATVKQAEDLFEEVLKRR